MGESTICKSRVKGLCVLLCCPAGHQTVVPPVDPFGVRAVLRTLPRPLFLGVRASLSGAVVPDAGADVGVLHYTRPSDGVSHPHVVQFPRLAGSLKAPAHKTQTTSAKNGEKGLFQVKWSVFWALPAA